MHNAQFLRSGAIELSSIAIDELNTQLSLFYVLKFSATSLENATILAHKNNSLLDLIASGTLQHKMFNFKIFKIVNQSIHTLAYHYVLLIVNKLIAKKNAGKPPDMARHNYGTLSISPFFLQVIQPSVFSRQSLSPTLHIVCKLFQSLIYLKYS